MKQLSPHAPRPICTHDRCRSDATCVPRLAVPPHKFSLNQGAQAVTALMGLPLCDIHFRVLRVGDFLRPEVKQQIAEVFRQRNAMPDFERAGLIRVLRHEPEFQTYLQMQERARAN